MNNNIESKVSQIENMLKNDIKAKVQQPWLKECIAYFLENGISSDKLYENVKEQFLLANLADSSLRVIPEIFSTKKTPWHFQETMLLQMQKIIDISEPFYDQWKHLHNKKLDEVVEDTRESKTFHTKKKRTLKLELTDGYTSINAMEISQIACLSTKLTPGIKILFIGPIQIANHIMLIKAENVKIIGGEVEELLVCNAYENVLLKLLKKPTTDNPIMNYIEASVENEKPPKQIVKILPQSNQTNEIKSNQKTFIDDIDDEGFDLAMIEAIEANVMTTNSREHVKSKTPIFDDEDDEFLAQIDLDDNQVPQNIVNDNNLQQRKRKSVESPEMNVNKLTKSIKLSEVRQPTYSDNDYPYKIEGKYNFITIDQYTILKIRDKMDREYAVEATVNKVLRIKATEDEWILVVEIKDPFSKNTISVRFLDEIVTALGRRSAKELQMYKYKMQNGQPQLKKDIEETLDMINTSLQAGPFLMCLKMKAILPANFENVITQILRMTENNRQMIDLKIQKENILLE